MINLRKEGEKEQKGILFWVGYMAISLAIWTGRGCFAK